MTQEQKNEVIALARNMYVKEGLRAVRMDDIAHAAGISKRTLYEAFGDKDELIYLAMTYHFDTLYESNNEVARRSPNVLVAIMRVMEAMLATSEVNWKLLNAMRRFHPKIKERIDSENSAERQAVFRKALERGVKAGLLNPRADLDIAITMLQFLSVSIMTESEGLQLPKNMTPQSAFLEIMTTVIRGISTTKGIAVLDSYMDNIKQ